MSVHVGKIGRLPEEIREQVNRRLADGEPGGTVLEWLNGLPAVRSLLATHFGGVPVCKVNLSRWRRGGYHDWQRERQRLGIIRELFAKTVKQCGQPGANANTRGVFRREAMAQLKI